MTRPQGLAVDSMGNLVVADTRNHRIVVFHPHGHFLAKCSSHGRGPGEFDYVWGHLLSSMAQWGLGVARVGNHCSSYISGFRLHYLLYVVAK